LIDIKFTSAPIISWIGEEELVDFDGKFFVTEYSRKIPVNHPELGRYFSTFDFAKKKFIVNPKHQMSLWVQ
jgi:hypothetical protein